MGAQRSRGIIVPTDTHAADLESERNEINDTPVPTSLCLQSLGARLTLFSLIVSAGCWRRKAAEDLRVLVAVMMPAQAAR